MHARTIAPAKRYGRHSLVAGLAMLLLLLGVGDLPSFGDAEPPTTILPCPAPTDGAPAAPQAAAARPVPTPVWGWGMPLPVQAVPTATAVLPSPAPVPSAAAPAVVEVQGEPYQYQYYVNGEPAVLRGMGYNVGYRAWGWDCAARATRYDRDFAAMRAAGFDTLLGWDEGEFDDLTMAKAAEHGLGVVFPYELPPTSDWGDPTVRQIHQQRVDALVRRYASHPALRMWGIGNEVLWMIQDVSDPNAQAFAEFYAALAERVHTLDPHHPILYRDSEDVRLGPIRDALRARDLEQPWMVYGMTAFTFRLQDMLDDWPTADFRVPLLVSDIGLWDYPLPERAAGLVHMWDLTRQHSAYVLGAGVYAWTTQGVEISDAQFGLVDGDNQPIDESLDALRAAFATR